MDFCGCGEDIALKQMFSEEEQGTFSTSEHKTAVDPAATKPVASRSVAAAAKPCEEHRQEDIVVETVESDGTMERQTVFNPKGRDAPAETPGAESSESETEADDGKATKNNGTKKGSKKMFKLPKLKKRSQKNIEAFLGINL
eukprot:CAMPEP_0113647154 /NCGR_PEP_ID=MMETSP0017_2-20120614/24950_1 /TAXON_ID=2856 /ORGANISM="Cylindrotheca closterium" /LENGTH=141 /DNA_ID=CAMNT_0000559173 /DNA_START=76 /DNA_END=498 /DNA_ORIENTATION=+ /assembly_acc=CAM_ASM_000147